jgi:rubredoxin
MDGRIIKEALAYSLASDLHEAWREPRKKADGTFEPRIKKSKDEAWNEAHGTNKVDIANTSFAELPSNWQYENLEAARVAIELVYEKAMAEELFTAEDIEKMASIIHKEWLKRNDWVFDEQYGDPKLTVSYEQLSKEEQDKDKAQLVPAIAKVQAYKYSLIDIDTICQTYGINANSKTI